MICYGGNTTNYFCNIIYKKQLYENHEFDIRSTATMQENTYVLQTIHKYKLKIMICYWR